MLFIMDAQAIVTCTNVSTVCHQRHIGVEVDWRGAIVRHNRIETPRVLHTHHGSLQGPRLSRERVHQLSGRGAKKLFAPGE
jgi:hypothetical protein